MFKQSVPDKTHRALVLQELRPVPALTLHAMPGWRAGAHYGPPGRAARAGAATCAGVGGRAGGDGRVE